MCWMKSRRPSPKEIVAWATTTSWDGTQPPRTPPVPKAPPGQKVVIIIPSFPRQNRSSYLLLRWNEIVQIFAAHTVTVCVYGPSVDTLPIESMSNAAAANITVKVVEALQLPPATSSTDHNSNIGRHFMDATSKVLQPHFDFLLYLGDDIELQSSAYLPDDPDTAVWSLGDAEGYQYNGVGAWGLLYSGIHWHDMRTYMLQQQNRLAPDWMTHKCCTSLGLRCIGFGPHTIHTGHGKSTNKFLN